MARAPRPLPFVLAATEQGTLIVNHKDYQMVDPARGYGVGFQLLSNAAFDADEVGMVLTLLGWQLELRGRGVCAIDCGANVGVHTIEWARHMTGWGDVLAFEAQERIFYALAGNVCLNNCFNARAMWAAVGNEDGTMMIPVPNYTIASSFGSLSLADTKSPENIGQQIDYRPEALRPVRALRIDGLSLPRVDLIKIDVEGMELDVLNGARDTIGRCRPYLLVEHIKTGADPLVAWLRDAGYQWWNTGLNLLAMPEGDAAVERVRSEPSAQPG